MSQAASSLPCKTANFGIAVLPAEVVRKPMRQYKRQFILALQLLQLVTVKHHHKIVTAQTGRIHTVFTLLILAGLSSSRSADKNKPDTLPKNARHCRVINQFMRHLPHKYIKTVPRLALRRNEMIKICQIQINVRFFTL